MKTEFHFIEDQKVTCWRRNRFYILAESKEEAYNKIKSWKGSSVFNHEDDESVFFKDSEMLYETEKDMTIKENGGQPTLEIYNSQISELICDNSNECK